MQQMQVRYTAVNDPQADHGPRFVLPAAPGCQSPLPVSMVGP